MSQVFTVQRYLKLVLVCMYVMHVKLHTLERMQIGISLRFAFSYKKKKKKWNSYMH